MLLAKGEYQWCLSHLGDPQACFDSMRQSFETERARYSGAPQTPQSPTNGAAMRPPMPVPPPDTTARMKKWAEDRFVGGTAELIEVLVGVGRKAEAEKIRKDAEKVAFEEVKRKNNQAQKIRQDAEDQAQVIIAEAR